MKQRRFCELKVYRFKRFMRKGYGAFASLRKVVNIGVVGGAVLTCMHVSTTSAQQVTGEEQQKVMEQELDEVMVTASRIETPVNQTAKLVTVITKEQVERAPVQSIQDLLVYVANMDVVQRGGHGVQADISIRGGSFDQNAVLLNGVNLSNSHTGHYSFDIPVNLSDIERIEIIHGPSALIYGASAFSGGIHIITKKSADTRLQANIEAGMHNLRGMEIRGAAEIGKTTNSLSAGYNSSEGYIANSDYDIYNLFWQTRYQIDEVNKLDLNLGLNDKKYGANTFYSAVYPEQYEHTRSYAGSIKGEFGTRLKVIPILYWNRHHDQFDLVRGTDFGRNFHRNDTYGANLIFTYQSRLGTTSLGGELRKEDIMSSVLGKPMAEAHRRYTMYDDRTNSSVTLEHTVSWNRWVASAGVLMNHNTILSGQYKFYPSVNVSYRPVDEVRLYTSWSRSTRMPTFTDLYYTTETHHGNEGLRPERSESWDMGVKYKSRMVSGYLTGFLLWGRDIIDWVKETPDATKWASWNMTKINTRGIEAGVKFRVGELVPLLGEYASLALDYARMHQSCDTQDLISVYSLNYLRDKFTMKFNHRIWNGFSADWYFRFQKRMGSYEKYEALKKVGDEPYPAFSTLDLKLNYQYQDITFHLTFNNLCDTHYFDRGNIPQAGFWLIGGISYVIK